MSKSFLIVLGSFVAALLVVNFLMHEPVYPDLREEARNYAASDRLHDAERCYRALAEGRNATIDDHYDYIGAHFRLPRREKVSRSSYAARDDRTIISFYEEAAHARDTLHRDFGFYGMGLCASHLEDYAAAMRCFRQVSDRQLKYLNNSIGFIFTQKGDLAAAEECFKAEIAGHGNLRGAYANLIRAYLEERRVAELDSLLADTAARKYFTYDGERVARYLHGDVLGYLGTIVSRFAGRVNSFGFLGATVILLCWLFFLRRIDIYEPEQWRFIVATCLLGMAFSFGTYVVSDTLHEVFHFELNGNIGNDLLYCIAGIGMVEEMMKFLPLLIILLFTDQIDEPIDYIVYASVSALGFAFVENLIYLDEGRLFILHGRALAAAISHMIDSSIVAYGLMVARFRTNGNPLTAFLAAFLAAAATHGLYDFWLINPKVSEAGILTFVIMIYTFAFYSVAISNALNNTTFFDERKIVDARRMKDYLVYALSSVILLEFLMMAWKYGPSAGNQTLLKSVVGGAYLIVILASNLSQFSIHRGEWRPVLKTVFSRHRRDRTATPAERDGRTVV